MQEIFKECLWKNFGATIDMFKAAIELCPEYLWHTDKNFFYMAYHTTIFLDYYLTQPVKDFRPLLPYTLVDAAALPPEAVDDVIPNSRYSRTEMTDYIAAIRTKCQDLILGSTDETLKACWISEAEVNLHGLCPSLVEHYTVLEILFYNFRHIQHHVGQLNLMLRQKIDDATDWVSHVD
jgi:hypothetical protein